MPQEIYIALVVVVMLLLYVLYRLQLMNNAINRVKKSTHKAVPDQRPNPSQLVPQREHHLTDDCELVAVLSAAIMTYENAPAPFTKNKGLPAHGFVIRRIVRVK